MNKILSHQELMNTAYDKWKAYNKAEPEKNWSYDDFIDNLPVIEAEAVILGNFNHQVCNGGFSQWDCNDYSSQIERLLRILNKIESVEEVKKLVEKFYSRKQDFMNEYDPREEPSYDDLDDAYYKINDKFMESCEKYFKGAVEIWQN